MIFNPLLFSCRAKQRRKSHVPDLYLSTAHIPRIQGNLLKMSGASLFCSQRLAVTVSSKATLHTAFIKNSQTVSQTQANIHTFYGAMWTRPRAQGSPKEKSQKIHPRLKDCVELSTLLNPQLMSPIISHPSRTTLCIRAVLPPLLRPASIT